MARTAADQFIAGKPAVYTGFDGKLYVAKYADGERNKTGAPSLTIKSAAGKVVSDIICAEHKARTFFWNLDAVAA